MIKTTPLLVFFYLLFGSFLVAEGLPEHILKIDLRTEWLIFKDGTYQAVPADFKFDEKTIYFKVDLAKHPNALLQVTAVNPFSIFINGKLSVREVKQVQLDMDSIQLKIGTPSILVAVYQNTERNAKALETVLIKQRNAVEENIIIDRTPTYFRDFVILGVVIILGLLILIVGQNPKLASDYFSLRKLFAASVSQDNLSDNRTTSSSNLLIQSFCGIVGGFVFTILFTYLKDDYPIAMLYTHASLWGSILIWLALSTIILVIFFTKQLIIYLFAYLFGMKELAVTHYFNLIRLLFWTLGISAVMVSIYLTIHGQAVAVIENLYFLIGWTLSFWVVLIFFKLRRRVGFSMFHLFSYLCATEIIPLIITIKVLYY